MNKVLISGNLTREPVFRTTRNGNERAWFTIACNEVYAKKDGTAGKTVNYPAIIAWAPLTEFVRNHLHKGTWVLVEGYIRTGSYKRDDTRIYTHEIYAHRIATSISDRKNPHYQPAPHGQGFADMGQPIDENEEIPF